MLVCYGIVLLIHPDLHLQIQLFQMGPDLVLKTAASQLEKEID